MTTSTKHPTLSKHRRTKLLKVVLNPFDRQVKKLADELLVEEFVSVVLNALETGSYEEALAEELVERFSALAGVEVTTDSKTA